MSSVSIGYAAVDSFIKFLDKDPLSEHPKDKLHCLADYIQAWLESGHGVRACQGDFQTFLIALVALIHYWHRYPETLDYAPKDTNDIVDKSKVIERRVDDIFPNCGDSVEHPILDPHFFAVCAFNELHGKRS